MLCDYCDKAFHKECLGNQYTERNPVSWFCPECEKLLSSENVKDPYCNHDLLTYLYKGEFPDDLAPAETANLSKVASLYRLDKDELILKGAKGKRDRIVPSPANRFLFAQVEHE